MSSPQPSKDMNDKLDKILENMVSDHMEMITDDEESNEAWLQDKNYAEKQLLALIQETLNDCLPKKKTLKTGLLWDSQDATDGYHQAITDMERNLINKLGGET